MLSFLQDSIVLLGHRRKFNRRNFLRLVQAFPQHHPPLLVRFLRGLFCFFSTSRFRTRHGRLSVYTSNRRKTGYRGKRSRASWSV